MFRTGRRLSSKSRTRTRPETPSSFTALRKERLSMKRVLLIAAALCGAFTSMTTTAFAYDGDARPVMVVSAQGQESWRASLASDAHGLAAATYASTSLAASRGASAGLIASGNEVRRDLLRL